MRIHCRTLVIAVVSIGLAATAAHGQGNCSGVTDILGSTTLNGDYATTASNTACLRIAATNVTLDCDGHKLICNNTSGCSLGISVEHNGATIKNCKIVSGTGNWTWGVINYNFLSGLKPDTVLLNNYIENATVGILLGKTISKNVVTNAASECISSGLSSFLAGTTIQENFCSSSGDGLNVSGPSTGTKVHAKENYVRAADVGLAQTDGLVEFELNIVDAPTDTAFGDASDVTMTENLCDDPDCEDPGAAPFGLSVTFN